MHRGWLDDRLQFDASWGPALSTQLEFSNAYLNHSILLFAPEAGLTIGIDKAGHHHVRMGAVMFLPTVMYRLNVGNVYADVGGSYLSRGVYLAAVNLGAF